MKIHTGHLIHLIFMFDNRFFTFLDVLYSDESGLKYHILDTGVKNRTEKSTPRVLGTAW